MTCMIFVLDLDHLVVMLFARDTIAQAISESQAMLD